MVESGSSEKLSLLLLNGSVTSVARLRSVRVLGADGVFRVADPTPKLDDGGALLPPGARLEVYLHRSI